MCESHTRREIQVAKVQMPLAQGAHPHRCDRQGFWTRCSDAGDLGADQNLLYFRKCISNRVEWFMVLTSRLAVLKRV
jgi:hypothetical protein